ncbi:DegT/DnrJ/EryC1/StrS family aminotransferase [Neobacillus cucumis]|uniref:DegT/DnrJ/EryC1/StrS family aminotransferase n=1 Tax=Neobacillus cucumis TaxID=1740721 RepID=UPI0018DFCB0C|nr:DegT/DnrJ/EryC1/StrS family aminotransferase [Neobacillus cucumis]MBI0577726.1 DegT/DnrJ/EryC1/StrS family aminotransferase [Neobacillus cucumis]
MKKELIFNQRINVTQPKLPDYKMYTELLKEIWENKWLTNDGPLHERFKEQVKKTLLVENAELFTNGHLALEIALKSLDLSGEVITTPFTFASTTHAISNCGLTPVFCDIDPLTYNIDPDKIEQLITPNTSAIVAVHVFGTPCDVGRIEEIAKKHQLKVIYDAAHAFGVEINGQGIGSFGDISMFSLHATKVFHSIEGGLLTYKEKRLAAKIKSLKNFGITSPETVDYIGTNAKMNEFQAAMGLCNLESIRNDIHSRGKVYEAYLEGLNDLPLVRTLIQQDGVKPNYAYFPMVLPSREERDQLFESLKGYNVFARKYFYPLCNQFSCYKNFGFETPIAKDISDGVLCLPMYADLKVEQVQQITEIIKLELGEQLE